MQLLRKELIRLNVDAKNSEEALRFMAQAFVDAGVAKESYPDAIVAREKNYPTALPGTAFDIAMPHTFAEHVNEAAMGVCVLKNPVQFQQMGEPETTLHPQVLFMLAIIEPKEQLVLLSKIMELIQNDEALMKIKNASSEEEVFNVINPLLED